MVGADRFVEVLSSLEGRRQFNVRASYNEGAVLQEVVAGNPQIAALRVRRVRLPADGCGGR